VNAKRKKGAGVRRTATVSAVITALVLLGASAAVAKDGEGADCFGTPEEGWCEETITVTAPPESIGGPPRDPGQTTPPNGGSGGGEDVPGRGGGWDGYYCPDVQACLEAQRSAYEEAVRKAQEEAARRAEEEALQKRLAAVRKALEEDYPACLAQVERWRQGEGGIYSCEEFVSKACKFSGNPVLEFAADACNGFFNKFGTCNDAVLADVQYCGAVRDCIFTGGSEYGCRMDNFWARLRNGGSYADPWPDETLMEIRRRHDP
jgi:hypothetical protein